MKEEVIQLSTHEMHVSTGHHAHDENLDHQGNLNLALWLGMVSATFFTATFVGTNLYLRGWSPTKFVEPTGALVQDAPYFNTLFLLLASALLFVAGVLFVKNRWRAFNAVLAVVTLAYVAVMIGQFDLMVKFVSSSQQVATIYGPTATIQFLLSILSVILCIYTGWYTSFANKARVNYFFPVAVNVWLYSAASGIVILLTENVMTVGKFAAWCGQHLT